MVEKRWWSEPVEATAGQGQTLPPPTTSRYGPAALVAALVALLIPHPLVP